MHFDSFHGIVLSGDSHQDASKSEAFVTNAVIIACIIGIILVAALIILSPREKEAFTQLWLKPWKLNLTNLSETDPLLEILKQDLTKQEYVQVLTSSWLGNRFYVNLSSLEVAFQSDLKSDANNTSFSQAFKKFYPIGDTIFLGDQSLFLDAIDDENKQILFWEYPRTLNRGRVPLLKGHIIRFAFVIENNLGEGHEYRADTVLENSTSNITKISQRIWVEEGEQKICVVAIPLREDDISEIFQGNPIKVSVGLDTGEEVFFWVKSTP